MTDEERKAKRREYNKRWHEAHPGYRTAYMKKYRQEHREELNEKCRGYQRKYRETHREQLNEKCREYQRKHREAQRKRMNDYHETKKGRATNLLNSYVQADLERRGRRPELTQDDVIRKCFSDNSKCVYCGETSWKLLGLDRIDNSKAHDAHNTVCSCSNCNIKRYVKPFGQFLQEKGYPTFEDWMESVGATYAEDTLTVKYPEPSEDEYLEICSNVFKRRLRK